MDVRVIVEWIFVKDIVIYFDILLYLYYECELLIYFIKGFWGCGGKRFEIISIFWYCGFYCENYRFKILWDLLKREKKSLFL